VAADGTAHPTTEDLCEVAREILRCMEMSPPDRHAALRWVAQFMDDFERADPERRGAMVAVEPDPTGDQRWDAMLAAAAEHLCYHHGLSVPSWTVDPTRFLERWWFVSPYRSVHASALVSTPAAFANRGVFIHAGSLASV
jgi:hypothetical protein